MFTMHAVRRSVTKIGQYAEIETGLRENRNLCYASYF
jgi:hypothetical protein